MIKAPYNFVPLNKEVVIPHWGKHISHDIPFRDGVSGSIKLKITAKSPIFVRDGARKPQSDSETPPNWFSQFKDQPFIPGSSLRGMVRSVVEIMSFGKMKGRVNDHRYAIRDLSPAAKSIYLDKFNAGSVKCGWLQRQADESYEIQDCDEPGRISHKVIDEHFGTSFWQTFEEGGGFDPSKDSQKSALFKYSKVPEQVFKETYKFQEVGKSGYRTIYEIDELSDEKQGYIVFTGQPSPRKKDKNRFEFIFFENEATRSIPVSKEVMDNFFFAYHEKDKSRWSIDYTHWREKLVNGERVPVFFRKDVNGNVIDLGLSYLYKLPYENSIEDAIRQKAKKEAVDMADAIFGYIQNEGSQTDEESLKGRVHFGHAFLKSGNVGAVQTEVLSSPKASYYPHYVRQSINSNGKVKNKYKTFMDDDASIAGWKRYPIHRSGVKHNPRPAGTSEKIETSFIPLKEGAVFDAVIRFHNLQPIELGALLSALTFHSDQDAFHALGMAKPLGYGKVKLDVQLQGNDLKSDEYYLKQFEAYMRARIKNWNNSDQICELVAMAHEHTNTGRSELSYMGLDGFRRAKNNNEALDKYSKLLNLKDGAFRIKTMATDEDVKHMESWIDREKSIYESKSSPEEALKNYKEQQYQKLNQALEQYKARQIKAIQDQQSAVQAAEKEQRLEAEAAEARQNPPDWDDIDLNKRKAFDELKKAIQTYVEAYFGEKYDKLIKDKSEGVLPEEHRHAFTKKIATLASEGHKTEKKQLSRSPFERNSYFKKIREWVGEEQAKMLWEEIQNN